MKLSPRLKKSVRIATPVLIALLLTIAILPRCRLGAAVRHARIKCQEDYQEDRQEERQEERKRRRQGTRPKEERKRRRQGTRPKESASRDAGRGPARRRNVRDAGRGPNDRRPASDPADREYAGPTACQCPFTPPADCIVAHAATPAQICPIGGGLQYYFIGPGSSQPGPWIQPFSELATLHAGGASIYSGTNPFTGKSVQIHYLPAEQKIRISTFYPDNQYDTNKPYNFTVDANNSVSHEAW